MKKFSILLAILVLLVAVVFILTGCGNEKNSEGTQKSGGSENPISAVSETNNWETFYDKYSELSDDAYSKLESNSESFDILNFIAGDVDLAFCSSFFTNNEIGVKTSFEIFGYQNINYETKPTVETLKGTDSNGKEKEYKLEFDKTLAKFTLTSSDEIIKTDIYINENTWAKSYLSNSLAVRIYQEGDNIYFGYSKEDLGTYINADKITKDSVLSMTNIMQLENGEFTSK